MERMFLFSQLAHPVEYSVPSHPLIRIHLSPGLRTPLKPGYWYIAKPLYPEHGPEAELAHKQGLKSWYWGEGGWRVETPIQFHTPEDALWHFIQCQGRGDAILEAGDVLK